MISEDSNSVEGNNETNRDKSNPYAYLERDFSSENYKIEVKNLPKYYGIAVSSAIHGKNEEKFFLHPPTGIQETIK